MRQILFAIFFLVGSAFGQQAKVVILGPDWIRGKNATALDGKWIAVDKKNTFSEVSVDPGDHRFCVAEFGWGSKPGVIKLTAEPGKTYYLRPFAIDSISWTTMSELKLEWIDEYQAQVAMKNRKKSAIDHEARSVTRDPNCT